MTQFLGLLSAESNLSLLLLWAMNHSKPYCIYWSYWSVGTWVRHPFSNNNVASPAAWPLHADAGTNVGGEEEFNHCMFFDGRWLVFEFWRPLLGDHCALHRWYLELHFSPVGFRSFVTIDRWDCTRGCFGCFGCFGEKRNWCQQVCTLLGTPHYLCILHGIHKAVQTGVQRGVGWILSSKD